MRGIAIWCGFFTLDVAGEQSTGAFQKVAEAYAVLADPLARRRHDAELATPEERAPGGFSTEPSAPWRWGWTVRWRAESPAVRPFFALLEDVFRNFTGIGVPKTDGPQGVTVEVILTPEEAARGFEAPIAVPRVGSCFECGGTGRVRVFPCDSCWGRGLIVTETIVPVPIPPLGRPEWFIEVPVPGHGIHHLSLHLYVRVE